MKENNIMKKGDVVLVTNVAKYSGQDMDWTEPKTSAGTLPKGTILYHTSENKLTAFAPKETCFYTDKRGSNHMYTVELLEANQPKEVK